MKKILFAALGAGLLLTSCQSDEPILNPGEGQEIETTFTINVPEAMGTRAGEAYVSSAKGGFTNTPSEDLYYTVALVNQNDKVVWQGQAQGRKTVTFTTTVVSGYQYRVIAYARFDKYVPLYGNNNHKVGTNKGSIYNDDDNLDCIYVVKGINDETEDAYYCDVEDENTVGGPKMSATLKRPFGKLRLVAEDYDEIFKLGLKVKNIKVTYPYPRVKFHKEFSAAGGEFNSDIIDSQEYQVSTYSGETNYADEANKGKDGVYTVFVDYLAAPKDGSEVYYPFDITVEYEGLGAKETFTRTFTQDIPVKRNHLTTLRGNFFTEEAALKLTIDEIFEEPGIDFQYWDGHSTEKVTPNSSGDYIIENANQLAWFAKEVNGGNEFKGKTVKLNANIDLGNKEWTPIGGSIIFKGTFDGQGHTVKNLVVNGGSKSNQGFFGNTHDGEIKDLTIENAKVSGRLNVGVVAGNPYTSKYNNIKVTGHVEVNGLAYVGGVGGKNAYDDWTDITVDVDGTSYVKAYSIENGTAYRTYVGGVIGFMGEGAHTVKNVKSNINVYGSTQDVGGIVGIAHYDNKFENIECSGNVKITNASEAAEAQEIGGIAGVWHNQNGKTVEFTNCKFTGELSTNISVAYYYNGLVGAPYSATGTGELFIDGVSQKVVSTAAQLTEVIKNATSDVHIEFAQDINGEPVAVQKEGVNVTINGKGHKFNGTIYLEGQARHTGVEKLTLKNINFEHADGAIDFISCNTTESAKRYAHNVTVEDCTFEGNSNGDVVAMRYRQCYNMTVKNCTFENVHSAMWATGGSGITVDGAEISNSKNGFSFGTNTGVEVVNSDFNVTSYGIRADGSAAIDLKVGDTKIVAKQPVIVRELTKAGVAVEFGANVDLTANATDGYQVILTNGADDEAYVTPTGKCTLSGADNFKVYPEKNN